MKRNALLGMVLVYLLAPMAWAEDPVHFADAKLKALVEAKLGVSDPTPTDMLGLTSLSVNNQGVTSLTGIEYATNLTYLYLEGNEISSVAPLAGLTKLTNLLAGHNRISSVAPLAGLTNLTKLTLHHNKYITSVSALSGLTNLTNLSVDDNQISSLSPLSGLTKLEQLGVSSNPISSLSALSGLTNLTSLYASHAQITSLSALSGLTELRTLSLSSNQITSITPLAGLTKLYSLYLDGNQIGSISVLSGLTQLTVLSASSNDISSISALTGFTRWRSLDLVYNPLSNEAYCTHLPQILANNPSLTPYDDLYYSANTTPPANVSASNGVYPDRVMVEWDTVCSVVGETAYTIYRSESEDGAKTPLTSWEPGTSFEDGTAEPGVTYYYWVRARTSNGSGVYGHSDYSFSDTGWCGAGSGTHSLSTSSTAGGSVTTPGEGSFDYAPGTSVSVAATADEGYEFTGWTGSAVSAGKVGDAGAASTTVTIHGDYTLVANFSSTTASSYTLSVSSGAGGLVTSPGEGAFTYASGTSVSIVATPETNYAFAGWGGTAVSVGKVADPGAASTTVTMDGDYTLVASFTPVTSGVYLTLSLSAGAGGSVTAPGEGAFSYEPGTRVSIQAVADEGYTFSGWSGSAVNVGKVANASAASTTVTVDDHYALTANFQGVDRTLTLASTAGGWVTAPGEGSFSYSHNQEVTLEAQPEPGYIFVDWSGSFHATSNPTSVKMNADHHITATFAPKPPMLEISSGEGGSVIVPGEGAFAYELGTAVQAVALPAAGYTFLGWTGTLVDDGIVSELASGRVDFAFAEDATLHADFIPAARCLYVDDNSTGDPMFYSPVMSDPAEDGSWDHPFDSIQEAIDEAEDGDAVLVLPGTYREHINFGGKAITVSAFDLCNVGAVGKTILSGSEGDSVVVFDAGESVAAVLTGFTISGGDAEFGGGIRCWGADPIIANCVIVGNRANQGAGVYCQDCRPTLANCTIADNFSWLAGGGLCCDSDVTVINTIFYGNQPEQIVADLHTVPCVTYSVVGGGWPGAGNKDCEPYFVERGHWSAPADPEAVWTGGDYHLKSTEGHWSGWMWLRDGSTSPCVDAGHPNTPVQCESQPNGGRINLGAFGGTAEATRSPADPGQ